MKDWLRSFLYKMVPGRLEDLVIGRFLIPLFDRTKIKKENAALFLYDNGKIFHRYSFIDFCHKNKLCWPEECEKLRQELG